MEIFKREIDQKSLWIFVLIVLIGSFFSALIPPLQSPDERDHIKRAYLLSKGQIFLRTPPGKASGGEIDTGLIVYFRGFQDIPHHPGKKLSKEEKDSVSDTEWTGKRVFSPAPGTGYYFPLVYAPQAIGLSIGETLGLTINESYWLARFFVLTFSAIVMTAAFSITPANAFILGLLIVPMSIFQLSSASLDAFTTALTLLCAALFMRGANQKLDFTTWMSTLLGVCIFILVTSRIHLLPLLVLPLLLWIVRKKRASLWQFLVITAASLIWLFISITTTFGNSAITSGHTVAEYVHFYVQSPNLLIEALVNTVSRNFGFYKASLIGILGWLDAPFEQRFYSVVFWCLVLLAAFSVTLKDIRNEWQSRLALIILSLLSVLLVFIALLVSWNPLPTEIIEGVQGRYFIGPLIIFGYALSGSVGSLDGKFGKFGIAPLVLMAFMVAINMPKILVERYYMSLHEIADVRLTIKPSKKIVSTSPLIFSMTELHKNDVEGLLRIGIMFWHKNKQGFGDAELILKGPNGAVFAKRFSLKELANNEYHYFNLDSKRYTYGEISIVSGDGVSVWESHGGYGVNTCIVYEYNNGKRRFTPGCPMF